MVNSLQNESRNYLRIITVKTSKGTLDQFDFVFFIFLTEFIFPVNYFGDKKEPSQKKIKNNVNKNIKK